MRNILLAATCVLGLGACNSTTGAFDPAAALGIAGVDPTSALGDALVGIAEKGANISDKTMSYLAIAADKYCSNAPELVRTPLRTAVNAKMTANGSKYQLNDFCLAVAAPAKPAS